MTGSELETMGGSESEDNNFLHKKTEVRIVVGITCGLSVIGSLLIILSYLCFRSLRSRARQILVNISIMDLGVVVADLVGLIVYFDHYYNRPNCLPDGIQAEPHVCPVSDTIHDLCVSQAFFASYFNYGSIMWTISLSFYLYFLIVHHGTNKPKYSLYFSYIFCYLMPLFLTLWFLCTDRLGYAPYNSAGWCADILNNPITGERDIYGSVFGYDMWIYLTIVLVPLLSISAHLFVKQELRKSHPYFHSERYHQALQTVDYKFLLIPVVFIILRMWSSIMGILYIYAGVPFDHVPHRFNIAVIYLSGIGDSGQGFANAILFVLFTKRVREKFVQCICCGRRTTFSGETEKLIKASYSIEQTPPFTSSLQQ